MSEASINQEILFAARISALKRFTGKEPADFVCSYDKLLSRYYNFDVLKSILDAVKVLDQDSASLQRSGVEYSSINRDCLQAAALISRARKVASAETDSSGAADNIGRNLASVFSRLSLREVVPDLKSFKRYELTVLESSEKIFPKDQPETQGLKELAEQFDKEMKDLADRPPSDLAAFTICFDRLGQQYMWCITASDYEGEDISLYDYEKVTEAITACLLRCEDDTCPYVLVMGDFSGIQKYIFGVSSVNHGKVAKRLRARSFYVDMICRICAQYIIDRFRLNRSNILLQTGGKFYCMVPASKEADEILASVRSEIDEYLYQTFHGAVSVNMAWLHTSDEGLEDYSSTIVELNDLLKKQRSHPFESILHQENGWSEGAFELYSNRDLANRTICKECETELISKGADMCPTCKMQISLGGRLPSAKYILYRHRETKKSYRIFKDYYIELTSQVPVDNSDFGDVFLIEALNDAPITGSIQSAPVLRRYMVNHIPKDGEEPKTFEQIAAGSVGTNKLAVLKADVDVLGFLFSQGLRTKARHFGTISRVATMSRMLDLFFSGYINHLLCAEKKYADVYSVFSGGDDLFLIGPWNVMTDLSLVIHDRFHRFAAENPDITLSASVALFDCKEHISFMAEYSENQLDRAKNEPLPMTDLMRYKGIVHGSGRNAVCAMGELYSWDDFREQLSNADKITELLNNRKLNVNTLRRITKYSQMYRKYLCEDDVWSLMFHPMFTYDIKRNYDPYRRGDGDMVRKWFMDSYVKLMESVDGDLFNVNLFYANSTIKIALNRTKKERS